MKRHENAVVAPATLFMGATVLAVVGAAIYYATRDGDDEATGSGGGNGGPVLTPPPKVVPSDLWNTGLAGTLTATVTPNQLYNTVVNIPEDFAGMEFDVRPSGGVSVLDVRGPEISNTPGVGAMIGLTFKTMAPGTIELVWPKGSVVGQDILTLYRRLNVIVGATV